MSDWSFATLRVQLAEVTNNFPMWQHAYQAPSDMLNTIAVLPMDATDDYSMPFIRDTFYGCP
jgi:arginine utilization protein RocB